MQEQGFRIMIISFKTLSITVIGFQEITYLSIEQMS